MRSSEPNLDDRRDEVDITDNDDDVLPGRTPPRGEELWRPLRSRSPKRQKCLLHTDLTGLCGRRRPYGPPPRRRTTPSRRLVRLRRRYDDEMQVRSSNELLVPCSAGKQAGPFAV